MLNELKDLPVDDLVGIGMSKIQAQMLLRRVQAIPPIVLADATGNDDSSSSRSSSNISTTTTTITTTTATTTTATTPTAMTTTRDGDTSDCDVATVQRAVTDFLTTWNTLNNAEEGITIRSVGHERVQFVCAVCASQS